MKQFSTKKTVEKSNNSPFFLNSQKPTCSPIGYELPLNPPAVFYFYNEIGDAEDYVDFIHMLRYSDKDQKIIMHICSPGGDLYACLAIVNAMLTTEAEITTVLDGQAASAGAIIWLAGHTKELNTRHVSLMLHGASTGYNQSKTSDIITDANATNRIVEGLLDDLTTDLLTSEERDDIRKGVDVYLTGDDIINRMTELEEESGPNELPTIQFPINKA